MAEQRRVEVYCDDSSHQTRRCTVALLVRGDQLWENNYTGQKLKGGINSAVQSVETRVRYRLYCYLCKREVVLCDEATSIFDALAANGVQVISLHGLQSVTQRR